MHDLLKILLVLILPALTFIDAASQDSLSEGVYILHKFQQPIGRETYGITEKGDSIIMHSDFKFNDRGRDVPLKTTLVTNGKSAPRYFKISGNTSRISVINSEISIRKDSVYIRVDSSARSEKLISNSFCIGGYAPVAMQMLMIRYWNNIGRPANLTVYPQGNIQIKFSGYDTVSINGINRVLQRHFVKGLIWGNEMIWTDDSGKLAALFTNDAEGDKFEALPQEYVSVLPHLLRKAAEYGLAAFNVDIHERSGNLLLKNARVVDVVNGTAKDNVTIVIENGIISKIESGKKSKVPKKYRVIDVAGKTVLPGLWDMHAHFQQVEWGPAYLAAGITTVRDCGNEFDFINSVKKAIDDGKGPGPRIIKAGIVDGEGAESLGVVRADSREEAIAVITKYRNAGYEQIKIYSSTKNEMIPVICDEAHKAGMSVTGHVPVGVKTQDAVRSGMDQINHVQYIYRALLSAPGQKRFSANDTITQNLLQLLKEKKTVIDPTLGVYEWAFRSLDQPLNKFEPGVDNISDELRAIFRNTGMPPAEAENYRDYFESCREAVKLLHQNGITIVAGTDMMIPGFSLYRELELYTQCGMTPLEAIQTATVTPARVMNKEKTAGSVSVGKWADLIIVDGDPLQNISNLRHVVLTIKGGIVYDPELLRGMIGFRKQLSRKR